MIRGLTRGLRIVSATYLLTLTAAALFADYTAPYGYEKQFRSSVDAPATARHPLGTDSLGRDRFSRLLYATRTSLLLAPAAALLAVASAASLGGLAGIAGGRTEKLLLSGADLAMSLPWLFLMITLRALLPLDVPPAVSACVTFGLLGLLGWAGPMRVIHANVRQILASDYISAAAARGVAPGRLIFRHTLPNLSHLLAAQFWTTVPAFIVAEANLGMLGLGVTEPLPSWGSMLRELEGQAWSSMYLSSHLWLLAPLFIVVSVVLCCRLVFSVEVSQ